MSAAAVNWAVVLLYFGATLWLGDRVGRGQSSVEDYFLAGRRMPWWSASLSIVGTETSTLTFVGVPAIAYTGDLTFLQVAMGYVVGRFVVAALLVPAYFAGRVQTAYELLEQRFGGSIRRLASLVFLGSRCLADGVRLFATALAVQVLLPPAFVQARPESSLWTAIVVVTAVTLLYTVRGGLRAVIWNDSIQLAVYMGGAALAGVLLLDRIPGGWSGAVELLQPLDKLRVFDLGWSWSEPYLLWSGLLGGAVLTMATHGTDQMFVQRLLACGTERDARRAVVASGFVVLAQMGLFLVLGSLLFAFYTLEPPAVPFASADQVFARFIAEEMPVGLGGLVIAAVFAAAMSTLSSSMSSLASASTLDFLSPSRDDDSSERSALRTSRWSTFGWALVLGGVAVLARTWGSVLEAGLTITSITFGGVLGVFLLGASSWRLGSGAIALALLGGLGASLAAHLSGLLAWTWLTLVGAAVTVLLGASLAGVARWSRGRNRRAP